MISGTMGPDSLYNPIIILVLQDNIGCLKLVDEIKSLVSQHESKLISIMDASINLLLYGTSATYIVTNVDVDVDEENLLVHIILKN